VRYLIVRRGTSVTSDPAWLNTLADFQVTRRGNNRCESQRPSGVGTSTFDDIFRSWCGGCFDDDNDVFYTGPGAGHTNYGGGEIYGYDVFGTEEWFQATTPSTAGFNGSDSNGLLLDGTPPATHSYDELVFVGGEMWLGAEGSVGQSGSTSARGWVWDADSPQLPSAGTRGWTDLGLNTLSGSNNTGAVAYDPVTDRPYYCRRFTGGGTRQLASWNRSTKVRTEHIATGFPSFGGSGGDMSAVCIYNGSDSVFLGIGDTGKRTIDLQDLLVGSTAWQTPIFAGTAPPNGKVRLHFVPETNQLVTWEPFTNNLLVANVPANFHSGTFTFFRKAMTGLTITAPSEGINGVGSTNGTFGRFQVFRSPLGRICCFLVNETNQQPHIWPLPATPITP
jgi:hypothetical protein